MSMMFEQALEAFKTEFPGWWWKVGECHVSCDATISPDRYGPDEDLMAHRFFDDGFSVDLRQPSTVADALLAAMKIARNARAEYRASGETGSPRPRLTTSLQTLCEMYEEATETTRAQFLRWVKGP
jgi:hypothetical protein